MSASLTWSDSSLPLQYHMLLSTNMLKRASCLPSCPTCRPDKNSCILGESPLSLLHPLLQADLNLAIHLGSPHPGRVGTYAGIDGHQNLPMSKICCTTSLQQHQLPVVGQASQSVEHRLCIGLPQHPPSLWPRTDWLLCSLSEVVRVCNHANATRNYGKHALCCSDIW